MNNVLKTEPHEREASHLYRLCAARFVGTTWTTPESLSSTQSFNQEGLREFHCPPRQNRFGVPTSNPINPVHQPARGTSLWGRVGDESRRQKRPVRSRKRGRLARGCQGFLVDPQGWCAEAIQAAACLERSYIGLKFRRDVMAAMASATAGAGSTKEADSATNSTAEGVDEIDFSAEAENRGMKLVSCTRVRIWYSKQDCC